MFSLGFSRFSLLTEPRVPSPETRSFCLVLSRLCPPPSGFCLPPLRLRLLQSYQEFGPQHLKNGIGRELGHSPIERFLPQPPETLLPRPQRPPRRPFQLPPQVLGFLLRLPGEHLQARPRRLRQVAHRLV